MKFVPAGSLRLLLICLIAAPWLTGCQKGAPAKASALSNLPPDPAANIDCLVEKPVTEGEFVDAAHAIERAALEGADPLAQHFDLAAICDAGLEGMNFSQTLRVNFKKGFLQSGNNAAFFQQIATQIQAGGAYRVVHVHFSRGSHRALFRLSGSGGSNYHDLKLSQDPQGQIRVSDVYVLTLGEHLSSSIRWMAIQAEAFEKRLFIQKATQSDKEFLGNIETMQQMKQASAAGEHQRVLDLFAQLPPKLREYKPMLINRLMAAASLQNVTEYRNTVGDYRRLYPQDRAIDLLTLELLVIDKQTEAALSAIDRIDQFVGGDHELDLLRGNAWRFVEQFAKAEPYYQKAIAHPNANPDAYWELIGISLKTGDADKTLKCLLEVEPRFRLQMDDLSTLPDYAEFVKTEQYQEWLKRERK